MDGEKSERNGIEYKGWLLPEHLDIKREFHAGCLESIP